ncbi:hypothetical protein OKA05_07700 [Luteolibacter arcticus]|uniref:Verru_Chthon cassette protein A n=1 Tax=Luteolibacter arcticus TaxID=1581411 RepID=A0ABT3GHC1_9BACT|nr:hypothetical protein [Luteolibacter arcticus]MCW1922434.1 hypothetical protein [Luteolibacter arcticus]
MTASNPTFPARQRRPRGFALIISLSLMVLIMVLVTGLLGLSTISLRSGGRDVHAAQARANARMALVMAIGELQQQAGPDTRVTARADILGADRPPVLGVWKSWEGTDHDTKGRPVSPGNYASKKEARFLAWLTSGDLKTLPDTKERNGSVPLVGIKTVGDGTGRAELQVHLEPQRVSDAQGNGGFAWWIGGENQKARLPKPHQPSEDTAARWSVLAKSHTVADPKPFRMEDLLEDATPADRTVSLMLGDLIAEKGTLKASQEFFHDLSTTSVGLLTNTATGGWRKDLSLATENWTQLPSSNLPFFRLTPEKDGAATKPTASNATADRSMLYPWSAYRGSASEWPIYRHGPVSSWENLRDYATLYKKISSNSSGRNRINNYSVGIDDTANGFSFLHKVRLLPVVGRMQWVFSHYAVATGASGSGQYTARLLVTPVITMWNPYSVEITSPSSLSFFVPKPLPVALRYNVSGSTTFNCLTAGGLNNQPSLSTAGNLQYQIAAAFTLKPGETRVFSPGSSSSADTIVPAGSIATLQPGYRSKGGHYFDVKNASNQPVIGTGTTMIKADAKFDTTYDDGKPGVGIYLDMSTGSVRHLVYRMVYTPLIANDVYKPLNQLGDATLAQAATNPVPFMSTVFGARMASKTHLPAKGFVQSSPLVNYTAMGDKDLAESTIGIDYSGTNHPVNSPFDYSFIKHSGMDSQLPNASDTTGRGYIVTGFNKSDGLSRCVIAEIPVRPLASLGELQHWDIRYENPIPPFAFNLIGNSDASPLLPANAVINSSYANLTSNLQHDDSYCANHLLFDDWFFSSIAPDPTHYGTGGKNLQTTYTDFVSGVAPLANRAYLPIAADAGFASAAEGNATKLYDDHVKKSDGYRTIASRFEVEGMFNVNSTSVLAWRALLGHARQQRVPYIQESGSSWNVDASGETDHAVSRFSISGDVEAGKAGSSGSFPEATEFAGYRVLDDEVIDQLAEEIVKQVRARGPFLSLSEFVNRQLSSGNLALAGAVQAALNEVAKGGSNPFATLEATIGLPGKATANPPRVAEAGYRHPAAAEGWNAYGLPGWTRQADILRPLAPILSARDDTFVIRAHGDARDDKGNIVSRAVCEATVRRTRDYIDPTDAPELATPPRSAINKTFGRRFEMVSFRWLNPSEI